MPIKLLGLMKKDGSEVYSMVAPFMIGEEHSLRDVNGVYNAITLHGDMLGNVMLYGKGAGSLPTASAVVSDVVEIAKNNSENIDIVWDSEKVKLGDASAFKARYFVRLAAADAEDKVKELFGEVSFVEALSGETVFVTAKEYSEAELTEALKDFSIITKIRVAE